MPQRKIENQEQKENGNRIGYRNWNYFPRKVFDNQTPSHAELNYNSHIYIYIYISHNTHNLKDTLKIAIREHTIAEILSSRKGKKL